MARQIRPGQLQENVLYNISASFAVSASHEITHEVSSSYAESASFAETASHALNTTPLPAGIVSASAQITALGFVTSSATSSFVTNSQTSSFVVNSQTASFVNNSATSSFVLNSQTASFAITASDVTFADITASGNVDVNGDIYVSRYIRHTGDADTHIEFLDNKLQLHAGNLPFITLDKDASTPYPLTINNGGNRINFRVQDKDSNLLLKTNSEEFWAGLYFAGNQKLITQIGGIGVTGDISASGHITASGNISSSGTIVASNLSGTNTGDQDLSPYLLSANTASFVINSQTGSFITNSQTASMSVESASFAVTASHLLNNPPAFPFTGDAIITGSLTVSGSQASSTSAVEKINLDKYSIQTLNSHDAGFLGQFGGQLIISSSDFTYKNPLFVIQRNALSGKGIDLWAQRDFYAGGPAYSSGEISTIFQVTGSDEGGRYGEIHLGNELKSLSLQPNIKLIGHLTASAGVHISASAASIASFGTYIGDGSQLTGIISASYALTASHALNGGGSVPAGTVSGSAQITALGFVTSSATASFVLNSQTASFVTNSQTSSFVTNSQTSSMSVLSSSFALTASHALNAGSGGGTPTFIASGSTSASAAPNTGVVVNHSGSTAFSVIGDVGTLFSVDDSLTGTLFSVNDISGFPVLQAEADGDVYLGKSPQSLYTTAVISSNTANITQSIYGISTSSYAGAFIEYTAFSGSHDARAGSLMAIWSGSAVNFTETTTTDFGNTSNLLMQVAISQSQAQVQSYSTTAGYKIKTIIKAI